MITGTALTAAVALAIGNPVQAASLESTSATTIYHRITVDGVGVFYREAGPKDAPAIVLLHGFPSSSREFDRTTRCSCQLGNHPDIPLREGNFDPGGSELAQIARLISLRMTLSICSSLSRHSQIGQRMDGEIEPLHFRPKKDANRHWAGTYRIPTFAG